MSGPVFRVEVRYLGKRRGYLAKLRDGTTGTGRLPGDAVNRALVAIVYEAVVAPDGGPQPGATLTDLSGVLAGIAEAWGPEVLAYAYRRWATGERRMPVRRAPVGRLRCTG